MAMRWTIHLEGGPRRVNHAAVNIGEDIFSFGGYCSGEDYNVDRPIDIHFFNAVSLRWTELDYRNSSDRDVPYQRYGHTVVAYNNRIYLWGGRNNQHGSNILHCFDANTKMWSIPKTCGYLPGSRDGHSACLVGNMMYIFGGYEQETDRLCQDVFCVDLSIMVWSFVETNGNPPPWRDFHSISCINSRLYVFGGRSDQGGSQYSNNELYCNQIYYLDINSMTWVKPPARGCIPGGRRSHSAFVHLNKLYIFGGFNCITDTHYNDIYCYDPDENYWILMDVKGNRGPCPRRRQCCCLIEDKLYLFGGTSQNNDDATIRGMTDEHVDSRLVDHSDLHILDFCPTLKTLSILKILEFNLNQSHLPNTLVADIKLLSAKNNRFQNFSSG